jgi:hypothetical protein
MFSQPGGLWANKRGPNAHFGGFREKNYSKKPFRGRLRVKISARVLLVPPIRKLTEVQQTVQQLLAELRAGEKSVLVNEFPLELLKKELNNASYG